MNLPGWPPSLGGTVDVKSEEKYDELEIIEEERDRSRGLVIHQFEIRADDDDNLFIYKEISKEAAQAILEEMPHIVIDKPQSN